MRLRRSRPIPTIPSSAFAGFRFPPEIIVLAVRWYLRYGLSYRDVEELLGARGIEVDHVTIYRWVQRFTPLLADAAGPCRHTVGDRWFVDETYVKVAGKWRYVYRAVDQHGQVIDVLVSARRDLRAARRFFTTALRIHGEPVEVVTDRAPALRAAIEGLMPAAFHNTEQYANNRVECDHGRLKARLRPMRGLKRAHTAQVIMRGHALMQTFGAATTNSAAKPATTDGSRPRSPTSPARSKPETERQLGSTRHDPDQCNRATTTAVTAGGFSASQHAPWTNLGPRGASWPPRTGQNHETSIRSQHRSGFSATYSAAPALVGHAEDQLACCFARGWERIPQIRERGERCYRLHQPAARVRESTTQGLRTPPRTLAGLAVVGMRPIQITPIASSTATTFANSSTISSQTGCLRRNPTSI